MPEIILEEKDSFFSMYGYLVTRRYFESAPGFEPDLFWIRNKNGDHQQSIMPPVSTAPRAW